MDPTHEFIRPTGSVRVRRGTVSRPAFNTISEGTSPVNTSAADASGFTPSGGTGGGGGSRGRRRAQTLTQRLFADNPYQPITDETPTGRARSPSNASLGSGAAHAVAPISVSIPIRASQEELRSAAASPTVVSGRRRGSSISHDEAHHGQDEVDLLEVLDQSVSTTATLTNIQSAFIPNIFTRQPIVELEPVTPVEEESDKQLSEIDNEGAEELDALDEHLKKLMKRQKRKEVSKEVLRGIKTFIMTPIGVFFALYGIGVVISGGTLVLMLMIPFNSYRKKLWIEIFSQILTGLFTITSLLPLPWRVLDWWNIGVIWYYASVTRKRRQNLNLPPLRDPNDLPDPPQAEYWVSAGGEKIKGPKTPAVPIPPKVKKAKKEKKEKKEKKSGSGSATPTPPDRPVELAVIESKLGNPSLTSSPEEEVVVLSDSQENRLRRSQVKFSRSQTWYRPHTTPTHHASPIKWAVWFTVLMIGNSAFQAMLCGVMWGLDRWQRPAWTTGCLIPLSFGCGIGAAVLVWQSSVKTKRKAEVTKAVWAMMKADEAKLEQRKKEAAAQREAAKKAKEHHFHLGSRHEHHHPQQQGEGGSTANLNHVDSFASVSTVGS